jgi:predicted PurR-regulated permease PerM
MVPVGLIDNLLRPILVARGFIGGPLAYGLIGLFFGPIVLSVAWALICEWVNQTDIARPADQERYDVGA